MPKKNSIKTYAADTLYHLYNRGVDRKKIFNDKQDYNFFLKSLSRYLSPPPKDFPLLKRTNLNQEIELMAYVLMPNHFHLLVKQSRADSITKFVRRICTSYSMYFNQKYKRSGTLFEGRFQAVIVDNDEQLLHLSRYIHLNPHLANIYTAKSYPYSSYQFFIGKDVPSWFKPKQVLAYFNQTKKGQRYEDFVMDYLKKETPLDKKLILENS